MFAAPSLSPSPLTSSFIPPALLLTLCSLSLSLYRCVSSSPVLSLLSLPGSRHLVFPTPASLSLSLFPPLTFQKLLHRVPEDGL